MAKRAVTNPPLGHSWCGISMSNRVLALDLGGLKGLNVDAASLSTQMHPLRFPSF